MGSPARSRERSNNADHGDAGNSNVELRNETEADLAVGSAAATAAEEGASTITTTMTEAYIIEPGTDLDDEFGLASDLLDADTTASLTSSIYARNVFEYGRRYLGFGNGSDSQYPIPNDDLEQNREDMKHAMLMMLTKGQPFFSPIEDHPQKILDIGTGTGVWAIEVGDKYPSAHVRGIDLTPIQPEWVPANVSFVVDDCTLDWLERDVDLAHFRFMVMILKDIPTVLGHAYESLRPGGWIELQELQGVPLCDDGTMMEDDPVKLLYDTAREAYATFHMSTKLPGQLEPYLRDAGFENIHCKIIKVPIGIWAKEKTLRLIGLYQKMAVLDFIPTLAGRPFKTLGISVADAEVRLALARKGLDDPSVHRYFEYYFWYAQKPGQGTGEEDMV